MSGASADSASWLALSAWVRSRGGFLSEGLSEGLSPETGVRGLVTSSVLNDGETILYIPLSCFITNTKFKSSLEALSGQLKLLDDIALALALLAAQSAGTHAPYVNSLPTSADFAECLPSWWSAEDRASLLHGSPLLEEVEANLSCFEHDWALLLDVRIALGMPQLAGGSLRWALAVVTSRAFTMDSGVSCLIPGMDIMNHRRPRVASYTFSEDGIDDTGVKVKTLQAVQKGAEVTITYGAKSNSHLLCNYGFTVAGNTEPDGSSNDLCRVRFSLDSQPSRKRKASDTEAADEGKDEVHALRLERWKAFKTSDDNTQASQHDDDGARLLDLRLTSSSAPKHYMFGAFTKCLDTCRVLSLTAATIGSTGKKLEPQHTRSEVAALNYLAAHLLDVDARYANPPANYSPISCDDARRINCIRVISSERRTLQFYAKVATTVASILRRETTSPRGDSQWKTAALETLAAADATASQDAATCDADPFLSPLCTVTKLVHTFLQVKFGVKL